MENIFDTGETKPRTLRTLWFIVAIAIIALVAVFFILRAQGQPSEPEPTQTTQAAPPPTAEEHLHPHDVGAPRAAWTAANTFLNGWTSTDKATRAKVFAQTALPDLAEGLADTSEENTVTAPIAGMDVLAASPYSTEFRVWILGDDVPVWMMLTSGHATDKSPYDWRVAEIEKIPA